MSPRIDKTLHASHASAWLAVSLIVACSSPSPAPSTEADASTGDGGAPVAVVADASDAADETDAPDAQACPLPSHFGSPVCERCISAHCCDEVYACDRDPDCHVIFGCQHACLLAPNAGPCIEKCLQDTPAGAAKYKAFDACVASVPPGGCAIDCSE